MPPTSRHYGDSDGTAYGLLQSGPSAHAPVAAHLVVIPGQMAYLQIPAAELRSFADGLFPNLATNRIADTAAGYGHRYRAGHDLLLDVPATFSTHGPLEGLKHAGHIIFTDFPTKAGIPIPAFSHSGLGQFLERVGISSGWLQLSLFDTGVGVFAFADGASALSQAVQGALSMDFGTAFQTFGVGTAEIGLGMITENPLLLAGGLDHLLAGLVSTWETFSVYVDPLDLLGGAGTSALLGFGVAYGLAGQNLGDASLNAVRSGAVGALYSISASFGFGAVAGFVAFRLGMALAKHHNAVAQARLMVDQTSYRLLVTALREGNLQVRELLTNTAPRVIDSQGLSFTESRTVTLPSSADTLPGAARVFAAKPLALKSEANGLVSRALTLADDAPELSSIYRAAFPSR